MLWRAAFGVHKNGGHIHCCLRQSTVDPPALRIDWEREPAATENQKKRKGEIQDK